MRARWASSSMVVVCCVVASIAGCGSTTEETGDVSSSSAATGSSVASSSSSGAMPIVVTTHPSDPPLPGQSKCEVVETTDIPVLSAQHVTPCTPVEYSTNPPSGGNHWPIWAAYQEYTDPVPHELYVHDEEHGGVILLYKCSDACPDVVQALEQVAANVGDVACATAVGEAMTRVVITPDDAIPTPIAVGAWGRTYTATCIDIPSLEKFANAAVGHGTEALCNQGIDESQFPVCN